MLSLREHPVTQNLFRTVIYLCIGSGLTLMILVLIMVALGLNETNNFVLLFFVMGLGAFVGGTLWAKSVIQIAEPGKLWNRALLSGLVFGVSVFIAAYSLEIIERDLFYRNLLNAPGSHMQFVVLFSIAIFLVAGLTSTVLAAQTMERRKAIRYGLITALSCVALFIMIDLLMFALGWRVGHPDFPERSTMLTVMMVGLGISLLVGGTLIGVLIQRTAQVSQ